MMGMMMSVAMLATASVSSSTLPDTGALASNEAALVNMEAKWANVNRITFVDEYSLFNSGVAKLQVGKPVTVYATIDYSGDLNPILQSVVTFENVDSALAIDYDGALLIDGKQATFSFTVTLLESIQTPKLFSVKVSDGQPEDNQYLTPYSQRQTVVEDVVLKDSSTEPSNEPKEEDTTTSSEETKIESSTPPNEEPKLEESIESSEPLVENSTEPSTESRESSDKESSVSSNEKPGTGSSTTSSGEDSRKIGKDSRGGKPGADAEATGISSVSSKPISKRASFPSTGENTGNRLFPVGVFVTSIVLLMVLYMSEKKKK
nr:peptidase [Enterococcus sp. BWR-S5]